MRVILIVLDSVGIGALPDAEKYGDEKSNTLLNIKRSVPNMDLKNMIQLGLACIDGISELADCKTENTLGAYCKLSEASEGKDTTIGHWEVAGIITENAFPTYPNGFPSDIIKEIEKLTGRGVLGNCTASGTEIIKQYGDEHIKTGKLIIYTSADSVFQIAAHEDIVSLDELYDICLIARKILIGQHNVSRVIARPFIGKSGAFVRTKNRKDFSIKPTQLTMLDYIKMAGLEVAAVGKIEDIFAGQGITKSVHTKSNSEGIDKTISYMRTVKDGLIFTNLVDFDMLYGHRNDPIGYADALIEFDNRLPEIYKELRDDDILLITADHGCDPVTESTDHSREYVPLLIYGKKIKASVNLHTRETFADIAATIIEYLKVKGNVKGKSFLKEVIL